MKLKEKSLAVLRMLAVLLSTLIIPAIMLGVIGSLINIPVTAVGATNLLPFLISLLFILLACFIVSKIYKIKLSELGICFTKN